MSRPRRSVLVVDSHPDVRNSTAQLLGMVGFDVRAAATGPEALALLAERPADVALVELVLPKMDGLELARRLTADPHAPALVAHTTMGRAVDRERAQAAGFAHLLLKPADPVELVRVVLRRASRDLPTT